MLFPVCRDWLSRTWGELHLWSLSQHFKSAMNTRIQPQTIGEWMGVALLQQTLLIGGYNLSCQILVPCHKVLFFFWFLKTILKCKTMVSFRTIKNGGRGVVGQIWPTGHSLPSPGLNHCTSKNATDVSGPRIVVGFSPITWSVHLLAKHSPI